MMISRDYHSIDHSPVFNSAGYQYRGTDIPVTDNSITTSKIDENVGRLKRNFFESPVMPLLSSKIS